MKIFLINKNAIITFLHDPRGCNETWLDHATKIFGAQLQIPSTLHVKEMTNVQDLVISELHLIHANTWLSGDRDNEIIEQVIEVISPENVTHSFDLSQELAKLIGDYYFQTPELGAIYNKKGENIRIHQGYENLGTMFLDPDLHS